MENLCCKIECLRQRMHVTALEKGISHPEVLMISCELDELLNEFYKIYLLKERIGDDNWSKVQRKAKCHHCVLPVTIGKSERREALDKQYHMDKIVTSDEDKQYKA